MDVSGVSAAPISMITNTASQATTVSSVAMQKKAMDMQKEMAARLISSIEQSAPKPKNSGSVGGNIDVTV
ncbi:MAG: putative motility protein [Candidatus Thiodiazotropha sp. (ex Lucinoma borealis)]|nr:putative motility protein [Candidatus Thiodiazotropha sp. (ex Lucinoma borealis)]